MQVCVLLLALVPLADAWPEFRGPTGQGLSTAKNVPTEWGPEKNLVWKRAIAGKAWSSPVIADGHIYLSTAIGSEQLELRLLCLDAATGREQWNTLLFRKKAHKQHPKNSQASPTPIVDVASGCIYVHFGPYGTACVDSRGKPKWKNDQLDFAPVHGTGGSPALVDGLLVFTRDGASIRELVALDAATGKVKWQTKRTPVSGNAFSFGTPLVITVKGQKQIISPASGMVGAYDVATGKEIWRVMYKGYSVIPRPVFAHGMIFIGTGYDSPSVLAIRPDGRGDVTPSHVVWKTHTRAPHTPSLLVVGDELYMVSDAGFASCLDARTGKVHWSQRLAGKGYSASPIAVGDLIYFLSEDGVGTVIRAGTTFQSVATNRLGERTLASYAVLDNALFVRSETHLFRFGNK
ncbi:MAG: PQQ-binding-like beta-propeller repeat protein [Gemmataceae bacterium]